MLLKLPQPKSNSDYRYERKFHVLNQPLWQIQMMVKANPVRFSEAYPPRNINNVYFDTPALTSFRNHVNGTADRSKVRLRWYGDKTGQIEKSTLEVKGKRGAVGDKLSFPMGPMSFNGHLDIHNFQRMMEENNVNPTVKQRVLAMTPSLFNRYHRHYYQSADKRFRLTIDSNMSFRVINDRNYSHRIFHQERTLTVLELKYPAAYDTDAATVSGSLPFRLDKISKYVYGIEQLSGWAV